MVKTLPSNALGAGLIPAWEAKIPYGSQPKKQKHKQYCNKLNKDLKKREIQEAIKPTDTVHYSEP